jgi:DNA-binding PadR family transcriptional regulator
MFSRRLFQGFAHPFEHGGWAMRRGGGRRRGHEPDHERGHGRHGHGPGDVHGEWHRGRGFGRGGGGGRIFGPGDLRLMLLALIAEKPRHGYELIKAIEQKFGGTYSPSPGSIYPTLTLLEELDHVRAATSEGARKLFEITDQGRAFLDENRATLDGVMTRMGLAARAMSGRGWPESVHQAMHTLKHALLLRPGEWSEAEATRVRKLLERAADAIVNGPTDEDNDPAGESKP